VARQRAVGLRLRVKVGVDRPQSIAKLFEQLVPRHVRFRLRYVRENKRKLKTRMTFEEQLNLAMNQTLSRTILTSGSVVIVLIALLLFGGKVIHEFAWILLIGVLAGTYSTITIVPAVALAWNNMTGRTHDVAGPAARARVEPAPAPREENGGQRKRKAG